MLAFLLLDICVGVASGLASAVLVLPSFAVDDTWTTMGGVVQGLGAAVSRYVGGVAMAQRWRWSLGGAGH